MNRRNFISSIIGGIGALLVAPFVKAREIVATEEPLVIPIKAEFVNDNAWTLSTSAAAENEWLHDISIPFQPKRHFICGIEATREEYGRACNDRMFLKNFVRRKRAMIITVAPDSRWDIG